MRADLTAALPGLLVAALAIGCEGFFGGDGDADVDADVDADADADEGDEWYVPSPHLLRIDPPTDSPSRPDALWYLGLNRTVLRAERTGAGLRRALLCIR